MPVCHSVLADASFWRQLQRLDEQVAQEVRDETLDEPEIRRLISNTTIGEKELYNERFPAGRWGDVTLVLNNGERLNSGSINARGGPDNPLSTAEILTKFHCYADPVLRVERAAALEPAVMSMDTEDSNLTTLIALLTPEACLPN